LPRSTGFAPVCAPFERAQAGRVDADPIKVDAAAARGSRGHHRQHSARGRATDAHAAQQFGGDVRRTVIPQTVLSLVAFLFLVAPGILFELRRERRRPGRKETAFREAGRTALARLLFSVAAVLALLVAGRRWPTLLPDAERWLREGRRYCQAEYGVVVRFLLLELGVALLMAVLTDYAFGARQQPTIRPLSSWYRVFRTQLPAGTQPFVRLRVEDGTEYCGMLASYTADPDLADRELVLAPPLTRQRPAAGGAHSLTRLRSRAAG
jgi:hypothetical protein